MNQLPNAIAAGKGTVNKSNYPKSEAHPPSSNLDHSRRGRKGSSLLGAKKERTEERADRTQENEGGNAETLTKLAPEIRRHEHLDRKIRVDLADDLDGVVQREMGVLEGTRYHFSCCSLYPFVRMHACIAIPNPPVKSSRPIFLHVEVMILTCACSFNKKKAPSSSFRIARSRSSPVRVKFGLQLRVCLETNNRQTSFGGKHEERKKRGKDVFGGYYHHHRRRRHHPMSQGTEMLERAAFKRLLEPISNSRDEIRHIP